jgi:flagellar hook-associated protein FlgK
MVADRLSQLAGTRAEMQKDGSVSIYLNGMALVSGVAARELEVKGGVTPQIGFVGDPDALQTLGGELASLVGVIKHEARRPRSRHREWCERISHERLDGSGRCVGQRELEPTLRTHRVARGILRHGWRLGGVDQALGGSRANNIALALSALRDDAGMDALRLRMGANFATQVGFATGESYLEHYQATVSGVGVSVSDAQSQRSVFTTLAQQADIRRTSVSGVSLDEELTLMMRHQQAYVAATRMVHVADEMAQAVINLL